MTKDSTTTTSSRRRDIRVRRSSRVVSKTTRTNQRYLRIIHDDDDSSQQQRQQPPNTTTLIRSSSVIPFLCFVVATGIVMIMFHHIFTTTLEYLHRPKTLAASSSAYPPIVVFDDVLDASTCRQLHHDALKLKHFMSNNKNNNNEHNVSSSLLFPWPRPRDDDGNNDNKNNNKNNNMNTIEDVIDCLLQQLYPSKHTTTTTDNAKFSSSSFTTKFVVEYWVRPTWHHTLAHADIDEEYLETYGVLRHPHKGHVLYLLDNNDEVLEELDDGNVNKSRSSSDDDGTKDSDEKKNNNNEDDDKVTTTTSSNGPTIIFANVTKGGDMYAGDDTSSLPYATATTTEAFIVPFRRGRLLQFDGRLLHAVPRPTTVWFHPSLLSSSSSSQGGGTATALPPPMTRSVVLFNLWHPDQAPMGLNYSNNIKDMTTITTTPAHDDDDDDDDDRRLLREPCCHCNPRKSTTTSTWTEARIVQDDYTESFWDLLLWWRPYGKRRSFWLPLMGNVVRRGTDDVTMELSATDLVEHALVDSAVDKRPKRVYVTTPSHKRIQQQRQQTEEEL